MNEIISKLVDMTAFGSISWGTLLMWLIAFILLYLGIRKEYEPLLLVPIGFGVLLANLPMAGLGIVDSSLVLLPDGSYMNLLDIANEYGIMNFLYYALIKTGLLPPIIFMGVGALTDFGPMLRNLNFRCSAVLHSWYLSVLIIAVLMGFDMKEAASLAIIGGADGPLPSIPLSSWLRTCLVPFIPLLLYGPGSGNYSIGIESADDKKEFSIHMKKWISNILKA